MVIAWKNASKAVIDNGFTWIWFLKCIFDSSDSSKSVFCTNTNNQSCCLNKDVQIHKIYSIQGKLSQSPKRVVTVLSSPKLSSTSEKYSVNPIPPWLFLEPVTPWGVYLTPSSNFKATKAIDLKVYQKLDN